MLKITLPHRFDFGDDRALVGDDLLRPEAWDALRTQTDGPFGIPSDIDAAADAQPHLRARAEAIADVLRGWGARRVVSYGVGAAIMEQWLARVAPDLHITLTEYAPGTVARLREVLPDADVQQHDLLDGPAEGDAHLFHRIDTDLSNEVWGEVFPQFAHERVIVAIAELMTVRGALHRWRMVRAMPPQASHAGWARTRAVYESWWKKTHDARPFACGDLQAWALEPRS